MMYFCPICGYTHERLFVIKMHYKDVHDITYCYLCGRKYKSAHGLIYHCMDVWDDDHKVMYYLVRYSRSKNNPSMISMGLTIKDRIKVGVGSKWRVRSLSNVR